MIPGLLAHALRTQWRTVVAYGLAIVAYGLLVVAIYPITRQDRSASLDSLPLLMRLFLGNYQSAEPESPEVWLVNQYFQFVWVVGLVAFAISLGTASLAREIETGTMGFLLSAPVSRTSIVFSRFLVLALTLGLLVVLTWTCLGVSSLAARVPLSLGRLAGVAVLGYAFFLVVGAYSLLMSALANDRATASLLAVGVTALFYLAHFVSTYWPAARGLSYLTLFGFYRPLQIVESGQVPWQAVFLLIGQAIVYCLLAIEAFRQRDLML